MYYVYIIRSINSPNITYIWFSENLRQRIQEHNNWKWEFTAKYIPWEIIFYSCFKDKKKALDFEKYLKSWSWKAFLNKRFI